uniref:Transposase n=1 Tax=Haemonchus contortus TaxID=6289 RepID=A0A7I4Y7Y7_HAECO
MVGITLHQQWLNRLHNEDIRSLSKVRDIILHIDKAKHTFAGHLIRRNDGRWSATSVCWEPREKKRPRGRPPLRWQDSLAHRNNIHASNSIKRALSDLKRAKPAFSDSACSGDDTESRLKKHTYPGLPV